MSLLLEALTKAALYAAVLPLTGAVVVFWAIVPRRARGVEAATLVRVEAVLAHVGLLSSCAALAALLLRAWAHSVAAFSLADSFAPQTWVTVALESRWGQSWQLQALCASLCIAAFRFTRVHREMAWGFAGVAAVLLTFALTRTGHAAGEPRQMVLHSVHIVAAAVWLGTLLTLVMIGRSVDPAFHHALFHAFAVVAMAGAGLMVAAGLVMAYQYVGSVPNLWRTDYGRVLLAKVFAFLGVLACGYVNWRRVASSRKAPDRLATIELILAAAIVVLTGFLTELEHP